MNVIPIVNITIKQRLKNSVNRNLITLQFNNI